MDIGLIPMDATCWVTWGEGIESPQFTGSSWGPLYVAYFMSLLLSFWVSGICLLLLLVSIDVDISLFVLDYTYEIYGRGSPSTYVYCIVCCLVRAVLFEKCCRVFADCSTLDEDFESQMDYELSLLPIRCFYSKHLFRLITCLERPPVPCL